MMDLTSSTILKEQTSGKVSTVTEAIEIDSDPADENLQLIVDKDCFTLNSNYIDVIDVDNDEDVEIIENIEPPIVIDDDIDCVEVTELQSKVREKRTRLLEEVCKENVLLSQIIEECINLDNLGSMKRIINKTLIPLYMNCPIIYKKSDEFQNSLRRTMNLLETSPRLKFSHLKSLCELMKYDYYKKKLPILQQREARKVKAKKRKIKPIKLVKRRKVNISQEWKVAEKEDEVIVINDHVKYIPYKNTNINSTNEKTTEKINTSTKNTQNKDNVNVNNKSTKAPRIPNQNKENVTKNTVQNNSANGLITSNIEKSSRREQLKPNTLISSLESSQELLRPSYAVEAPIMATELKNDKVTTLENEIKELKKELAVLEEMEVSCDDNSSPYLRCEQIKAKIVNKYKKICLIMGTEAIKRHEVKLQVAAGHPEGPAKCLEEYLNDNLDENGDPPFPDIFDVVECVEKADKIHKLNWNRKQIVQEAESLLKIYGKALQKRRMKREWRDMKSLVKKEIIDPADFDPVLEARLMDNRRIGLKNEEELLNRYVQLEKETNTGFSLTVENDDESDSDYEADTGQSLNTNINTNVDIVNNIYLDIVKDTGVDVSNNTSRNIVNNGIDTINNTSPNIADITRKTANDIHLNVVNNNDVTINNVIKSIIEKLINVNPNVVNNTSLNIVNNADHNTVSNSVTINNTINTSLDIVNNSSQNVIENTVTSTTDANDNSSEEISSTAELPKTKISTEELPSTITNVTPIFIFGEQEFPNEIENIQCKTTKIDNIEYNRTIMIEEEEELSDKELKEFKPCIDSLIEDRVPSTNKLPDSILSTDQLLDSIRSPDDIKRDIASTDKLSNSIINTENNLPEISIPNTDKLTNSICSADKLPNSIGSTDKLLDFTFNSDNLAERDKHISEENELEVKVKQEREDITKLLEELGDDFTATVFDIQDPFLVIEISDSSDSEEDEEINLIK